MIVECKFCNNKEKRKKEELLNFYNWKCSKCFAINQSPLNEANFSIKYNCSMPTVKRNNKC